MNETNNRLIQTIREKSNNFERIIISEEKINKNLFPYNENKPDFKPIVV
jgi:hypothetical protein